MSTEKQIRPSRPGSISKRSLLIGASAVTVGGALPAAWPVGSHAQTPTLTLYVIMWGSEAPKKVRWDDPVPRKVVEAASFMIWRYIQKLGSNWVDVLLQRDKPSVIGHAALLAVMTGQPEPLLFSNTGGDVGFYKLTDAKHDRYFSFPILASCYLVETLAGHLADGKWETLKEFATRMQERGSPRIQKVQLTGANAVTTYKLLAAIKQQTEEADSGPGAPRHFGLNTTGVRFVTDMTRSFKMKSYQIGGKPFEVHGGCANAVASVLQAARLGSLVPASAGITMRLTLSDFDEAVLPVLVGGSAFDAEGNARDKDLRKALDKLPEAWWKKDAKPKEINTLRFTDPNYWIKAIPDNPPLVEEVHSLLGI